MSVASAAPASTPRFTLVSAVYRVEQFLPEFIASVEAQDFPLDRVQVVMVDDGSTDASPELLAEWQARHPDLVTVVSQDNAGQGAARNAGLDEARGEWVSFPDPDDVLAPDYLSEVDAFLRAHPETEMVGANLITFDDVTGEELPHPLRRRFVGANRVRDLDHFPAFFHASAPVAFFRRESIESDGLRFDQRIRPNFEDGHFSVSYLLRRPHPVVGFVGTARYRYRKRSDATSTTGGSRADPRRYTAVPRHGYLDLLEQAQQRRGAVPGWLQSLLLYELSWYFQDEETLGAVAAQGDVAAEFHGLLAQIAERLDPAMVASFWLRRFDTVWREILLHAYADAPWHTPYVLADRLDTQQRLVRVRYRWSQAPPRERFFSDGQEVEPAFVKHRGVVFFDRAVIQERIVWLPAGAIRVELDGVEMDVRLDEPEVPVMSRSLRHLRERFVPGMVAAKREREEAEAKQARPTLRERLLLRASRSRTVRRLFADAWVLIDRVQNADDSAEVLFRHLRSEQRQVNAWFVIQRGTPDDRRLRKDGYKRVVPYGSLRWKLLMLNCRQLISSHADRPIVAPDELLRFRPFTWRFSFLQHGVMKDDLSTWLNKKELDLLVTSTRAEHASIVAEGSGYVCGERETRLTGLPRFDELWRVGASYPPEKRDLLLLAPTWRYWLVDDNPSSGRLSIDPEVFAATDFGTNWLGLTRSPELKALADRHGLQVATLLHPNLQPLQAHLDIPDHVLRLSFEGERASELFARSRVLVTDYSSMFFNVAYLDRPVVYFQFDKERFTTSHVGRHGYFDYTRDGFGPVTETLDEAVAAVVDLVEQGPDPAPEYAARIREAFPKRDGQCAQRVFEAITESSRRVPARPVAQPASERMRRSTPAAPAASPSSER